MNLGIYKASQGYWVRAMTAVMAGALFLAGAAWAWSTRPRRCAPDRGVRARSGREHRGAFPAIATTVDLIGITKDEREGRSTSATRW
jgi:hypothetical protein